MVAQRYRWDFIGLSTDEKPTAATSPKVTDGSTFYCSDNSKLYVWYKDQWYERKALGGGGGGGGTDDFEDLDNRPKYGGSLMTGNTNIPTVNDATLTITQNGVSAGTFTANDADNTTIALTDTTYSAFTGTDGTSAGASGLVPAPATTDVGKFLKADGTWAVAGAGGGGAVVELTTDDYDYPDGNANGIALWRLPSGLYHTPDDVQAYSGADIEYKLSLKSHFIIIDNDGSNKLIKVAGDSFTTVSGGIYKGFVEYKTGASDGYCVPASANSVITSASIMIRRAGSPTSSDVGFAGQLWYNTSTSKLYINVNKPSDYSGNWKEITLAS